MSTADKQKWETRYREGAYAERTHPSAYLKHALDVIVKPPPSYKALDLACGAGRNALYLAANGFEVDAVDIASEALQRGQQAAAVASVDHIFWREHDLDQTLDPALTHYGLIIMMRYLDVPLLSDMAKRLASGGYLLSEVHLQTDQVVAGPSSNNFRAAPGELKSAAEGLDIIEYTEGLETDPDGSTVAVARLLARKPRPWAMVSAGPVSKSLLS